MTGTAGAMREVRVKHKLGGISSVQFWSYSQGAGALMGDVIDWFMIDEEPKDNAIIPQVQTRTANGDAGNGGRGILTFTPENGRTEVVKHFMDEPSKHEYLQRNTWDDAPHLSDDIKEALLAGYPKWQRDMRTKGLPLLGSGLIYDIGDDDITCQAFQCPAHWYVINGMDFGWDHPQAHVQLWIDNDTDTIYLAHAWKKSNALPEVAWGAVKEWSEAVPVAWPHDGLQSEKSSGKQQRSFYQDAGFDMLDVHAQWIDGGNGVEAGLVELYRLMELGKFKVFSHLSIFFEEKMNYHRKENGKIAKVQDDILDSVRYAYMMRRFAVQKIDIDNDDYQEWQEPVEHNTVTGY
jgi:phage terminase large subunit-like protein